VAKEIEISGLFALQVSNYGMSTDEMIKMLDDWMTTLRPLYCSCTPGQNTNWPKNIISPSKRFGRIGSTIAGRKGMGRAGSTPPRSTSTSKTQPEMDHQRRSILYRLRLLTVAGSFWQKSICIRCADSKRKKTLILVLACRSWKKISVRSKA